MNKREYKIKGNNYVLKFIDWAYITLMPSLMLK